jgi:hypothetical protein
MRMIVKKYVAVGNKGSKYTRREERRKKENELMNSS